MPNTADHRTPAQNGRTAQADRAVQKYIDAITPEHRPLFDRLHRLILEAQPGATVVLSYQIPTYQVGGRRLYVGAWKHGVSLYGWQQGGDAGFTSRHPGLRPAGGPSGCGPKTRKASATTNSATWRAPPCRPKTAVRQSGQRIPASRPRLTASSLVDTPSLR